MRYIFLMVVLVGLSYCAVKKQTSSVNQSTNKIEEIHVEKKGASELTETTSTIDHTFVEEDKETKLTIEPDGPMIIHPDGTFEGNAKSVVFETKEKSTTSEKDTTTSEKKLVVDTTATDVKKMEESSALKEKNLDKKSRPAVSVFIGLGILFIMVMGFLILARRKGWI